jgi:hypothetical protein
VLVEKHSGDYDELFGTDEWRTVIALSGAAQRRKAIHDIYLKQLKTAAQYGHSFEMLNKENSTDYFLFFAINGLKGLEKIKEAMWKVDDTGSFQFSDHYDACGLMSLFSAHPNLAPLREAILKPFKGDRFGRRSPRLGNLRQSFCQSKDSRIGTNGTDDYWVMNRASSSICKVISLTRAEAPARSPIRSVLGSLYDLWHHKRDIGAGFARPIQQRNDIGGDGDSSSLQDNSLTNLPR